jgi:hypothetical protein
MGVPKGFVDTQKVVKGKTPWLPLESVNEEMLRKYGN